INCESQNELKWEFPVKYVLTSDLTENAEKAVNKTLLIVQKETCLNFTQIPKPPMDTNMAGLPPRMGIQFGLDRTGDDSCEEAVFGGDDYHPYTHIEVPYDYRTNASVIKSCIYRALGIDNTTRRELRKKCKSSKTKQSN
uniref:Peptidase M12A domain-containing protein n=1 Tax=Parastrongyloides trichosuri TaxID=131310 RepID=A0A0N4ZCU9_PARTI